MKIYIKSEERSSLSGFQVSLSGFEAIDFCRLLGLKEREYLFIKLGDEVELKITEAELFRPLGFFSNTLSEILDASKEIDLISLARMLGVEQIRYDDDNDFIIKLTPASIFELLRQGLLKRR